jgi:menaquinone-9 beta-reductase
LLIASSHFDLAIVGGGPAGTSAAITAARAGASVVLFESRQFPRHKVCGEFVSAEALDVLAELLHDHPATGHELPRPGQTKATIDQPRLESLLNIAPVLNRTRLWFRNRMLEAPISPPGLSIQRYHLDATLWEVAQAAGVSCRENCEVSAAHGDGPFHLETATGTISARALIVAAGRWSQFVADRALPPGPRWIGLKAHFSEAHPSFTTDLYFFENGYCGVQPVSSDGVNACAMVRSDRASSLHEVFGLHPALRERAANWVPVIATISTAPLIYRTPQPVRGNIAFVGDAAGFIDPFVGDGISIALRSGKVAAECLCGLLAAQRSLEDSVAMYEREYAQQFAPLLAAASRVRGLLSLNGLAQSAAFEMLRVPGLLPLIIRKTRLVA